MIYGGILIVFCREHLSGPAPARTRPVDTVSVPVVMPVDLVVAAVVTPLVGLADLETLLKRLLPNMLAPAPPPRPVHMEIETNTWFCVHRHRRRRPGLQPRIWKGCCGICCCRERRRRPRGRRDWTVHHRPREGARMDFASNGPSRPPVNS